MFEINDTVVLKRGGPKMIVICCDNLAGVPHVWCLWREKEEEKSSTFPESSLTAVVSEAPLAA
jgi:uncharacterized protein YodC (DUF2158 family)